MRVSNFQAGLGLATASGCLWFLACPPFDNALLAWVAAVPMLLALERAGTWQQALFLGWWAGVVETAGGFYWIIDLTQRFAGFPWLVGALVLLAFCATRALIFLVFAGVVVAIRRRHGLPMVWLGPIGLVIGEVLVPQIFPCGQWISQAWQPLVIQITEITGPLGVSALLMLVNGALCDTLARRRLAVASSVAAALLLGAALLFGAVRMRQVDAEISRAPRLDIGLVQPNFAYTVDGEFSAEEALSQLTALQQQSQRLQGLGARLVVWSEGAYPLTLPRDFTRDFAPDSMALIRRGFTTPVIIGASTVGSDQLDAYNSALLLDSNGVVSGRYDKVRLLAFGEYMPGIETFPWLRNLLPEGTGRFIAGAGPDIMTLTYPNGERWRLGPVICYEDLLPGYLRGVGSLHPDVLVNLTSDSWFGARTEPWQHLALAVFGAVELRVAMVRAVNSGVSAMIDPNGRLLAQTYADDPYRQPHAADGILVTVPKMAGGNGVFVRRGNWLAYACGLAAAFMLMWPQRRAAATAP